MKELTIEQKAKAYDEAYKKVAIRFGSNVADEIFPELKESEDEKIRKALIRFHKSTIDIDGIKGEDIIAWLEKQGEQKSAWSEEDEQITLSIEQVMNCASLLNIVPEKMDKIRTWLKSLKQRIGK